MWRLLFLILLISCTDNINEDMSLFQFQGMLPSETTQETVKVLILTGQSNAMGTADNVNALSSELLPQSNFKIWSKINSQFESLECGVNNISWDNGTAGHTYHGLELGLAANKNLYYPDEDIYLIKFAIGGTELSEQFPGGVVYDDLYANYVVPAINSLIDDNKIPEVQFIFAQGEADAADVNKRDSYFDKFGDWLDLWRDNLGSNLNIINTQILDILTTAGIAIVNNDFDLYTLSDSYYEVMPTKDLDSWDDRWHYSYAGFKDISILAWDLIYNNTWQQITSKLELSSDVTPPTTGVLNSVTGYTRALTFDYDIGGDGVSPNEDLSYRIYNYGVLFELSRLVDGNVSISGGVITITNILVNDLTTYSFTMTEIDGAGNESAQSNAIVISIDTHPHIGTLTHSNITSNSVDLSCTATDNLAVTGFQIFINGVYSETVATDELVNYTVSGLSTGTNYDIHVVAEDEHGNESEDSNTINFTTL